MDRFFTSAEVAEALGTSVPRVLRAARRGVVGVVRRGNRTLFPASSVDALRRQWGRAPRLPGRSREEVFVLAALARRPRGLRSARAVSRAAGVSPTAAARSLRHLAAEGLVERASIRVTEGAVRDVDVWRVRWTSPSWLGVAATVGTTVLPPRPPRRRPGQRRVPARLAHLFWNDDLRRVDLRRDAVLVAQRALSSDDPEALAWLAASLPPDAVRAAAAKRGTDTRRARLAQLLAGAR